jgi:DNA-binding NarL/FixJ family response regulator
MNPKINFAIIDKNLLLVSLLTKYLEKTNFFDDILSFGEVDEFWTYLASSSSKPDVVLIELIIQPNNGIELIQKLKKKEPSIRAIAYSYNYQLQYSGHLLTVGAKAYCSKALSPDSFLDVILQVFKNGHHWFPNQIEQIAKLLPSSIPKDISPIKKLTKREKEIVILLAQQKTTQEIANTLYISIKTVDSHKSSVLSKTGARNAVGLAIFAIKNQLIELRDIII